ncbi:uncharacterized protein LOC108106802 [Drosophila eugracilis]|uniref:uncharacterized protein LOC108106802 n=1 Tax=Drosophila eugracilis TaxID=29029 RepID=UPI0007E620CB|nr:uncharacterized protein LOC108106802 [Drosophila eugracilis]
MNTRLLIALLLITVCRSDDQDLVRDQTKRIKPGRYLPHLHGATGWYMPDNSGKYRHDHRPYDGGYGDRGQPYATDLRGIFRNVQEQLEAKVQEAGDSLSLGPRDHLRFMIDFNFNGTGWQTIQFQWVRDGDESNQDTKQYSYLNENKLWESDQAYDYQQPDDSQMDTAEYQETQEPQEPVQEPEEQQPSQEQRQTGTNINSEQDPAKIHDTINDVLEYIQRNILPNLR